MRTNTVVLAVVILAIAMLQTGCKRKFKPGVYKVGSVWQKTVTGPEETNRSQLRMSGSARFDFEPDGSFIVNYSKFGIANDSPCSGNYSGSWEVDEERRLMRIVREKTSMNRRCRPPKERIFSFERGWSGSLNIAYEWDDNVWIEFRLEEPE